MRASARKMRILVIDAHPDRASFCEAFANAYVEGAQAARHDLRLRCLRDLVFDPILHGGFTAPQPLEPDLVEAQASITWCERSARVIYTQNAPQWLALLARDDLFWRVMRRAILGHCGFAPVRRTIVAPMKGSTSGRQDAWLRRVRELGASGH